MSLHYTLFFSPPDANMLPPGTIIGLSSGFGVLIILTVLFIIVGLAMCYIKRRFDNLQSNIAILKKCTKNVSWTDSQLRTDNDSANQENIEDALKKWKTALEDALKTANQKLEDYGNAHSKSSSV